MPEGFSPLGSEFLVNSFTTNSQNSPSITGLTAGGYVIVWQSAFQDGSSDGVFGQVYDADGSTVGVEFQVNTETDSYQYLPDIVGLTDGGFIVTWTSTGGQDGDAGGIYAQRYDASGATVGGEFQVNTTTTDEQRWSETVALEDGGFVIIWTSDNQDGSGNGIYAQRYDSAGATVGVEFLVNTHTADDQNRSSSFGLPDGGFLVTWSSINQDGDIYGVFGQRYDASGATVGGETQINTETTSTQFVSNVTVLTDGGIVVTWSSTSQDGSGYGIYGQRYDASGASLGAEFQINTETSGNQIYSEIAAMADGGFVVVWQSFGQDGDDYGIYGQRYDASGDTVGAETLINTVTVDAQWSPVITSLADGGFVVSWYARGDSDGDAEGVFAQQFDARLFGTSDADTINDDFGTNWIDGQGGSDTIHGNAGFDTIFGKNGADILYGDNGSDLLDGGSGEDSLYGGSGADELFGGMSEDVLKGGNGIDILIGGDAKDKLFGGAGADVFVYNDASESLNDSSADVVKDYELGIDQIDLSGVVAGLSFIGTAGFSGTGAEVRISETGSGKTNVRIDVDGDGTADMKITVLDTIGMTAGDFIF